VQGAASSLNVPTTQEALLLSLEAHARELHAFLEAMPALLRAERLDEMRRRCWQLVESAPRGLEDPRLEAAWRRGHERLVALQEALAAARPPAALHDLYDELGRCYELWIEQLRIARRRYGVQGAAALDSVKSLIVARSFFHVLNGVMAAAIYQFLLGPAGALVLLGALLAVFGFLEVSRRFSARWNHAICSSRLFRPIRRPGEYHHVNSATWYLLGLCLLVPLASKPAVIAAVLILAFADPAAAWFGRRFGQRKLHRNKSVAGSAAFVVVALAVAWAYLVGFGPELTLARAGLVALAGACAGALAEVFSGPLDDNLTVPVASALTIAALLP
jgi:dolichol kinase